VFEKGVLKKYFGLRIKTIKGFKIYNPLGFAWSTEMSGNYGGLIMQLEWRDICM
jgi:hypothetical protein